MSETWKNVLNSYSYPFNLKQFKNAKHHEGWFDIVSSGNREETLKFENRFRYNAQKSISPWLEVVFWKIFSMPNNAANDTTGRIEGSLSSRNIKPDVLWKNCNAFVNEPTLKNLQIFKQSLGIRSGAIAVALTFPSFINPDLFPMVDTRIAKWVNKTMNLHNQTDKERVQLIKRNGSGYLSEDDFAFYLRWVQWCKHQACKLSDRTDMKWRARDVEMAVFTAWGFGGVYAPHPSMTLNPVI
jgi:hypothetical protein